MPDRRAPIELSEVAKRLRPLGQRPAIRRLDVFGIAVLEPFLASLHSSPPQP